MPPEKRTGKADPGNQFSGFLTTSSLVVLRLPGRVVEASIAPFRIEQAQLLAHCGSSKITREELKLIPTPEASATHQPIPHNQIVEGLSFRHISAIREEYAVSNDGMKMFAANFIREALAKRSGKAMDGKEFLMLRPSHLFF